MDNDWNKTQCRVMFDVLGQNWAKTAPAKGLCSFENAGTKMQAEFSDWKSKTIGMTHESIT